MAIVLVNAVAASDGGALTILRQFLSFCRSNNTYHIFISNFSLISDMDLSSNIKIHAIGKQKGISRLIWDYFKMASYAKKNKISPNLIVSLQNTPTSRFGNIPQAVYLHQAIPISSENWSFFNREERIFWFYKNIYPVFMRGFCPERNFYVCQAEWMRPLYAKLLRTSIDKIRSFSPIHKTTDTKSKKTSDVLKKTDRFFIYPAQSYKYKNHQVLVSAVKWIKANQPDLFSRLNVLITTHEENIPLISKQIKEHKLSSAFNFIGPLIHKELLDIFSNPACTLLFPSKIETVGLPLLEAASYGCFIIASDLPYARETLHGYTGVQFISALNEESWALAIIERMNTLPSNNEFISSEKPGWIDLFDFLDNVSISTKI